MPNVARDGIGGDHTSLSHDGSRHETQYGGIDYANERNRQNANANIEPL